MQRLRLFKKEAGKGLPEETMGDSKANQDALREQIIKWAAEESADVKLLSTQEHSLSMMVAGMQLLVSLPAVFFDNLCGQRGENVANRGQEDQFLVTAVESDCHLEDGLQRVNEKLEKLDPACCSVSELLDKIVRPLLQASSAQLERREKGDMASNMESADGSEAEGLNAPDSDDEIEEMADSYGYYEMAIESWFDSKDQIGERMAQSTHRKSWFDSKDQIGERMAQSTHRNEEVVNESEVRARKASFLHRDAEEARSRCAEAAASEEVYPEGSSSGILQWCSVESLPALLKVKLTWDLQGLMTRGEALALGLVYEAPIVAGLAFPSSLWAQPSLPPNKSLELEEVSVSQDFIGGRRESKEIDGQELRSRAEERRAYGIKVLVPELIHRFFRALARARVLEAAKPPRASPSRAPLFAWMVPLPERIGVPELAAADRADLGVSGFGPVHIENPFTALLQAVGAKLSKAATWCTICRKPHVSLGTRLRPCSNDLCLYRFEELGLGSAVLPEVLENPELVELELAMAAAAAASPRAEAVFEPFPSFLLQGRENRGRAGWFNAQTLTTSRVASEKAVKMLAQLSEAVQALPALSELQKCASEGALAAALVEAWYARPVCKNANQQARQRAARDAAAKEVLAPVETDPAERDPQETLPYELLRFVLSSNRLSLRHLAVNERLPVEGTCQQFLVLSGDPEKEAAFARARAGRGSFFAFHGSPAENWYSIVRNGLRSMSGTSYQLAGAAYGRGIYIAPNMGTSAGYCARSAGLAGRKKGTFQDGFTYIAIVEVINGASGPLQGHNFCFVVPRDNEDQVIIRYLLVYSGACLHSKYTISGDLLGTLSLSGHFQSVTQKVRESQHAQQAARQSARKQQRMLELRGQADRLGPETTGLGLSAVSSAPQTKFWEGEEIEAASTLVGLSRA